MERDKRSKSGRSGETRDEKDAQDRAAVVLFTSRRPIKEYKSFIKQQIRDGQQAFFFLAQSGGDLEKVKKLAESFKGKHGIVSVKESLHGNPVDAKGVVTLYRQNSPNVKM